MWLGLWALCGRGGGGGKASGMTDHQFAILTWQLMTLCLHSQRGPKRGPGFNIGLTIKAARPVWGLCGGLSPGLVITPLPEGLSC